MSFVTFSPNAPTIDVDSFETSCYVGMGDMGANEATII